MTIPRSDRRVEIRRGGVYARLRAMPWSELEGYRWKLGGDLVLYRKGGPLNVEVPLEDKERFQNELRRWIPETPLSY